MTCTHKQLAELAGVSTVTIYNAINRPEMVRKQTLDRIRALIQQHNYHENRLSVAFRTGKTGIVGVMIHWSDYYQLLLDGIHDTLAEYDSLPLLIRSINRDRESLHRLIEQRVDGVIFVPSQDDANNDFYQEVNSCQIPIVAVDRDVPADIDFVGSDDYAGGMQTAEYFYRRGHRDVAYYAGPDAISTGRQRRQGFLDFCSAHADMTVQFFGGGWEPDEDEDVTAFLKAHPWVRAIGCFSDHYAFQVLNLARKQNPLNVPEICGFGNIQFRIHGLQREFATFDQHPYDLGGLAVRRLYERINNPTLPPEKVRLKPEFIDSTVPYVPSPQ